MRSSLILAGALVAMTTAAGTARAQERIPIPKGKPAPTVTVPAIQKTKLSNGLSVWLVEHHELPVVAFNLVLQSGSANDPLAAPGIASMTSDVLDEGTSTRDAIKISDELESIGASLGVNSGTDGSFVSLRTLAKHLDRALAVYADVITDPVFPQKEFDRLKSQRLAALMQQKDQPTTIAGNAFAHILYTEKHPYGLNASGTAASIEGMKREDLVAFYQQYYRPGNATLIVVGDVKLDGLKAKLEQLFSRWKDAPVPAFSVPSPAPVAARKIYMIDKPGAPQSEIRIGYPALARSTPDFFPVFLMNQMLGGQFASRINMNLREKHGYTYGARSSFNFSRGVGPFVASAGVTAEKTDSSLIEFLYEIDLMREKGMTDEEMGFVKKGLIGNFALNFETPSQLASMMQNLILYGLPDDYYSTYLQNIEKVSATDVARVAKQYLDTSKMAIVVVGDMANVRKGVEASNIGEIVVCNTDGDPLP
jgi:predicted Zn-dependent peptidase